MSNARFATTFAALFRKESTPERVRTAEIDRPGQGACGGSYGEIEALGIGVPSDCGGADGGLLELALVAEEAGRRLAPIPVAETAAAARLLGSPRRKGAAGARFDRIDHRVAGDAPCPVRRPASRRRRDRGRGAGFRRRVPAVRDEAGRAADDRAPQPRRPGAGSMGRPGRAAVRSPKASRRGRFRHRPRRGPRAAGGGAGRAGLRGGAVSVPNTPRCARRSASRSACTRPSRIPSPTRVSALDGAQLLVRKACWALDSAAGRRAGARRDGLRFRRRNGLPGEPAQPARPRRIRVHRGVRHPALLPPGQGVGGRRSPTRDASCSSSRTGVSAPLSPEVAERWTSPNPRTGPVSDVRRRGIHRRARHPRGDRERTPNRRRRRPGADPQARRARLGRADVAGRRGRRRTRSIRGGRAVGHAAQGRRADHRARHDDAAGQRDQSHRLRRTQGQDPAGRRRRRDPDLPRLHRTGRGIRRLRLRDTLCSRTATSGSSTDRRSSPRSPTSPTTASC